ncbi:UvrD-helicase domain-containing protein [Flavobacterium tegetincola]|uniref:UvrD-helicase domain-containing protein n=1 Tax=Flavobacterium tegetincola TaxID=150172 RepID=UPI000412F352|nr:UvrD-helicase domain-containing protein [Flavobacterium tegetincola]
MQKHAFSIYDASAGSGKTFNLVKEYLKIILSAKKNDAYRSILAITFTNKAVHEMKSRIVGSLSEFIKDEPSAKALQLMDVLIEETELDASQIKAKSQEIIKHIIHNYAAFDISTIDKFTHKVIRTFAHDLDLPMTFEVSLDTENLLTEAVDAIIAEAGTDEMLTKLLIDFTMEKTDDDKSWDISREIMDTGRLILNENNREEVINFQGKSIPDFMAIKQKLKETCKTIIEENAKRASEILETLEKNGVDLKSFSRGTFPNHVTGISQKNFNPLNKRYHEFEDIAINKTAKDRAIIENLIPQMLSQLQIIYEQFAQHDFYKAFLKNITPLSLLNTLSNKLADIQKEQNILSIAEFNAIIHKEIQKQPAPFIYERMGERYKHFFIDEFQDTSEMQFQNLIPLIDNALVSEDLQGERGSLMIVGDPKQSIYRWRGGKAEQFIELSKDANPFGNPDKTVVHLEDNFRSYSQIIEFNNDFFKYISGEFEHEDYKDLYENHSRQNVKDKIGGYVNVSFLPKKEKSEEEDELTQDDLYVIKTLDIILKVQQQGYSYSDIAVVVRHNKDGVAVANYLTENEIPIQSSETLLIANATEVQFLIHALNYLKNANDLEAKAYFLYYVGFYNLPPSEIHDFIAKGMSFKIEKELEEWLETFEMKLSFQNIRKKALYETVELLISKCIPVSKNNAYLQYFLDIVLERDIKNQAGVADFLEYWEKKKTSFSIPSPEGNNAVRIISIHKSKGLEFPIVIFPFADENYSRQRKDKLWVDNETETFDLQRVLIDNNKAVEGFGNAAKTVFDQKAQEQLLDNINVLYVALTRPEEQLYIISQYETLNSKGEWPNTTSSYLLKYLDSRHIFEEGKLEYEFGVAKKYSGEKKAANLPKKITRVAEVLPIENIKIAQRESLMWGTSQQDAITYGNIIHEILSYIHTKSDIDLALQKALENGLIAGTQKDIVEKTIREIVNHTDLSLFFDENSTVFNEQTIIQKHGSLVKPDRMVLKNNTEMYLLDYKTGKHEPKYHKQLQKYQDAIEQMGYKVIKKSIIYIGNEFEIVNL